MDNNTSNTSDRTLGTIVRDLTEHFSTLVRSEIALAKLELKQNAVTLGGAGAAFGAALFCVLFAFAFFLVTLALGLAEAGVPPWLSSLIVGIVLLVSAFVLALIGRKKMRKLQIVPTAAVESLKTDVATIKDDLSKLRQKAV